MKTVIPLFCLIYTFTSLFAYAQNNLSESGSRERDYNKFLVRQLDSIYVNDQTPREQLHTQHNLSSAEMNRLIAAMNLNDSINLVKIKAILDQYGWLGPDVIGNSGNQTLFLVIQHADLKAQEKYLPMMKEAVKNGKARGSHLALLIDRIEMYNGRPQVYGSQLSGENGKYKFYKILDEVNVNKRRVAVGLKPLEEYAKEFNIKYKPLKK